jgi:hypothetical protein
MLVIAHHNIIVPEKFWSVASEVTKNLPENLKVLGVFPATDAMTGTCLWQADSVQEVQEFLDKNAGQYARNFCYEVDETKSMGLPLIKLESAQLS